jgi:hypothetical protein
MGTLTRGDVRTIVGELSEDRIVEIIGMDTTSAELMEAMEWLLADDVMGAELRKIRSGRVAKIYEILLADQPEYNEQEH